MRAAILLVLTFAFTAAALSPEHFSRIIGGSDVSHSRYAWYASTHRSGDAVSPFCGGTLVDDRWVLTAAHCWVGSASLPNEAIVRLNCTNAATCASEPGAVERGIEAVHIHPQFSARTLDYDVCLLELSAATDVYPVTLATTASARAECPSRSTGQRAMAMGFGVTEEDTQPAVMQEVEVPIVAAPACADLYAGHVAMTPRMICAGSSGKDACQGDSGGALVATHAGELVQIGIVSYGIGCGDAGFPGVYTRVSQIAAGARSVIAGGSWIHSSDFTPASCYEPLPAPDDSSGAASLGTGVSVIAIVWTVATLLMWL